MPESSLTRLTVARWFLSLPQLKLAQLAGIKQPSISHYERGLMIPADHAESLTSALKSYAADHIASLAPDVVTFFENLTPDQLSQPWDTK